MSDMSAGARVSVLETLVGKNGENGMRGQVRDLDDKVDRLSEDVTQIKVTLAGLPELISVKMDDKLTQRDKAAAKAHDVAVGNRRWLATTLPAYIALVISLLIVLHGGH